MHEIKTAGSVLLLGGTFDPPHLAHVQLSAAARTAQMPGALLVFVPAAQSPHKADRPGASGSQRAEMLRLAMQDTPNSAVWTIELDRPSPSSCPSYWVDTLREARGLTGPSKPLRFIIGADQAGAFHRWHDHAKILDLAEPLVLLRPPVTTADDLRKTLVKTDHWSPDEIDRWLGWVVSTPQIEVSATQIRDGNQRDHLHPDVAAYIDAHGLYQSKY